ncbi:MAG: DUF2378 family protein [Patescibacteria group bacterium]
MEQGTTPTIKGIFVMSHVKALEAAKGKAAVSELEKRFGKPVSFKNSENVPIRDEVAIIELALDLLSDKEFTPQERHIEAGRLHFKNFSQTPLGKLVLPAFKNSFKLLIMNANNIAGHVFQGVRFFSEDVGEKTVRLILENNDYPLEHFQGFFEAWLGYGGLKGEVVATDAGGNRYIYTVHWE